MVARLIEISRSQLDTCRKILDWLRVEHEIEKPTLKLQSPFDLDCDGFVAEVKKVRGKKKPLSAARWRTSGTNTPDPSSPPVPLPPKP